MAVNNNINSQGIDERIMSAQRASELREEKNKASQGANIKPEVDSSQGANSDIRQSKLAALKERANIKKRVKNKVKEKVLNPAKIATSGALKWAWGVVIPSWGLSIIYINMHVFLRFIFPDAFCKLGNEWLPKAAKGSSNAKNVTGVFGIVEIAALVLIDLILFFIILAIIYFVVIIADILAHPLKAAIHIAWGWVDDFFSNILK